MNTIEIRKNQLNNVKTILDHTYDKLTGEQCKKLADILKILSQKEVSRIDNMGIERLLAAGQFKVLLPY